MAQDLPRQIQNGKDILSGNFDVLTKNVYSYIEPEQPFANHHWLYGVIAYIFHGLVGFSGIVLIKTLLFMLVMYLLFKIALKNSDFWLIAFFSIPTMIMFIGRSDFRPELFSYFFISVFILLLFNSEKNPSTNKIYWLILLQLFWVNIHLYFPVGIMIILGFILERVILKKFKVRDDILLKKLGLVLLGGIIVLFINPFGLNGVIKSLAVNTSPDFPIYSSELGSLHNVYKYSPKIDVVGALPFYYMIAILFISFVVVVVYRAKNKKAIFSNHLLFFFLASVTTTILGFMIVRALPLFGMVFLLAVTSNLYEPFLSAKKWIKLKTDRLYDIISFTISFILLVIPLIYMTFFYRHVLSPYNSFGVGVTANAERSAKFLIDNNISGPIFNDTDVGSYLIYYLYPQEKVFSDNRFGDAYSYSFFNDIYNPMIKDENRWKDSLNRFNFNAIVFYQYDGGEDVRNFLFRRFYDPEWALVYADNYNIIFVRNNLKNKDIIEKYQITQDNMPSRLSYLTDSKNPEDHLAAADIYGLFGQVNWAMNGYLGFLSEVPTRGKVWLALSRIELNRADQENSNPYRAAIYLEEAIKNKWITPESLSYLALAYYRTGQIDRAKEMVKRELKIDPQSIDGHRWLGIFADYDEKHRK